jgi:hypothetical protein
MCWHNSTMMSKHVCGNPIKVRFEQIVGLQNLINCIVKQVVCFPQKKKTSGMYLRD